MSPRMAPLSALRAFEAAARHLSFTKAAAELHVTPAAISHQIKALESFYGITLFRRLTRALRLSDEGQAALPKLRDGFDLLADACAILQAERDSGLLTVSAAPSIAAKWLVTRLDRFRALEPDIDIRLDATDRLADFAQDGVDIAIRYGGGTYPGLSVRQLFGTSVHPVCSPRVLSKLPARRAPRDLTGQTLLHIDWMTQDETWPNWKMWLLAAGVPGIDPARGPRFSDVAMAIQAAVEGHGIALVSDVLAADDLAAGRLVRPFDLSVPVDFAYYVVCPPDKIDVPKVRLFCDWLCAEADATERDAVSP